MMGGGGYRVPMTEVTEVCPRCARVERLEDAIEHIARRISTLEEAEPMKEMNTELLTTGMPSRRPAAVEARKRAAFEPESPGVVVCVVWRRLPALDGHRAAIEEFSTLADANRWCAALGAVGVPAEIVRLGMIPSEVTA